MHEFNLRNDIPRGVLEKFLQRYSATPVEKASGGLSGASIYRCIIGNGQGTPAIGSGSNADLCLRKWPQHVGQDKLEFIKKHIEFAHEAGANVLPRFFEYAPGAYFLHCDGSYWELTDWMPGQSNYLQEPGKLKLRAAMKMLGELHQIWSICPTSEAAAPSPACRQRVDLLRSVLRPGQIDKLEMAITRTPSDDVRDVAMSTLHMLRKLGPRLLGELERIERQPVDLHFVLRDIWSDHVLFVGEEVTGIIDLGAARVDEPATDVARLLSSLEPSDTEAWDYGFSCYKAKCPTIDVQRVQVLDQVSCLLSAVQWLRWLVVEGKEFSVARETLLKRWAGFNERLASFS